MRLVLLGKRGKLEDQAELQLSVPLMLMLWLFCIPSHRLDFHTFHRGEVHPPRRLIPNRLPRLLTLSPHVLLPL